MLQQRTDEINDLIERNMGHIINFARKASNAVLTVEDAKQELKLKIIKKLRKDPDTLDLPIDEQDKNIYRVLHCYHVDLIRFYSRRPDTSRYKPSYSDEGVEYGEDSDLKQQVSDVDHVAPVFNCNQPENPERKVSEDLYLKELLIRAEKFEDQYPGIVQFIKEAINPSEEVERQYEEYQNSKKYSKKPSGDDIPPYTLIKFLPDVTESRLRRYHIVISKILSNLGVSRAGELHQRLSF